MKTHRTNGFTLIEALIYIALLGLLITGVVHAAYALSESRDAARATLESEGAFMMDKLQWVLTDAQVTIPAAGQGGTQLSLTKNLGIANDGSATTTTITAALDSHNAQRLALAIGANPPEDLNVNVRIVALHFFHATSSPWGASADSVGAYLELSIVGADGMTVSEIFMSTTSLSN